MCLKVKFVRQMLRHFGHFADDYYSDTAISNYSVAIFAVHGIQIRLSIEIHDLALMIVAIISIDFQAIYT